MASASGMSGSVSAEACASASALEELRKEEKPQIEQPAALELANKHYGFGADVRQPAAPATAARTQRALKMFAL